MSNLQLHDLSSEKNTIKSFDKETKKQIKSNIYIEISALLIKFSNTSNIEEKRQILNEILAILSFNNYDKIFFILNEFIFFGGNFDYRKNISNFNDEHITSYINMIASENIEGVELILSKFIQILLFDTKIIKRNPIYFQDTLNIIWQKFISRIQKENK